MDDLLAALADDRWIGEVFLTVFVALVLAWMAGKVLDRVQRKFEQTKNLYDDALVAAGRKPLVWLIMLLGICQAAETAARVSEVGFFELIDPVRVVGVIALVTMFGVRFVSYVEQNIYTGNYGETTIDQTTALAIGKLLRVSIIITAVLTAAQTLGFSISGVLAFGGVGGIAVGFAAREMLANFFGGLTVYLDRPFSVGDWIRSPDRQIEGVVEDIGWRVTRIRTFDQRPLYVPNATFTSLAIENPSRMLNRRIYETIGVRYDDVEVLPRIIADVRSMLEQHEAIDTSRTLMVNFNAFGASSLDFFVYTFTKTTVWTEFHAIKEEILLKISDIIVGHGAEIAYPTQTLHVAGEPQPEPEALPPGAGGAQA